MSAWAPGAIVGEYRLLEPLGAGGMGTVWRVEHMPTGAQRALKTTLADNPELVERFHREAQALGELEHPHVVRVHTAGEAQGRLYLVLDLAEGGDLAARLKQGPLDPDVARAMARELASGLAHVHGRGLLHRDLKPGNVLFDGSGRAQLVDFGLARRVDGSSLTQTGAVLGTPNYMAPEQAEGGGVLDERTDVYGLGAVLYHTLTGEPPFTGPTMVAVLRAVLEDQPASPRARNPAVSPELAAVCVKALAKDPAQRFVSARAFAEALDHPAALQGSGPPWVGVFAALVLVGAGVGGVVWAVGSAEPAPEPAAPVVVQASAAPTEGADDPEGTALEGHPIDLALADLPPVTLEELADFDWNTMYGEKEDLLAGRNTNMLHPVHRWLKKERGKPVRSLVLLYQCATHGLEVEDLDARVLSQSGWTHMGTVLRNDATLRRALWTDAAWEPIKAKVILECYRRAYAGGRSDGAVSLANIHFGHGREDLRVEPDIAEAQRYYFATLELPKIDPEDREVAYMRLARIAAEHPELPGRVDDETALRYAREAVRALADWKLQEAKETLAKLEQRVGR